MGADHDDHHHAARRPRPGAAHRHRRPGRQRQDGPGRRAVPDARRRRCASASSPTTSTPPRTPTSCARPACSTRSASSPCETGCCPHTAIRDDIAANLDAVETLEDRFGPLDLVIVESGGDNLTATFSRGPGRRADLRPRRGGRRQGPPQGRPRRHHRRPAGHQQDRPRPAGRRRPRRDGPRRGGRTRRPTCPVHLDQAGPHRRRGGRLGHATRSSPGSTSTTDMPTPPAPEPEPHDALNPPGRPPHRAPSRPGTPPRQHHRPARSRPSTGAGDVRCTRGPLVATALAAGRTASPVLRSAPPADAAPDRAALRPPRLHGGGPARRRPPRTRPRRRPGHHPGASARWRARWCCPVAGESRMLITARVGAGASLRFTPEPTVLAAGCAHRMGTA